MCLINSRAASVLPHRATSSASRSTRSTWIRMRKEGASFATAATGATAAGPTFSTAPKRKSEPGPESQPSPAPEPEPEPDSQPDAAHSPARQCPRTRRRPQWQWRLLPLRTRHLDRTAAPHSSALEAVTTWGHTADTQDELRSPARRRLGRILAQDVGVTRLYQWHSAVPTRTSFPVLFVRPPGLRPLPRSSIYHSDQGSLLGLQRCCEQGVQ